jgi:2-polyprenyl-3-methyl-5-hydroxy-6-metoxy-1,4-benzoquinol methylase
LNQLGEYQYHSAEPDHLSTYLWQPVLEELKLRVPRGRILDLGCGNGAFANRLASLGYEVVGIDPSESGITQAKQSQTGVRFEVGSAYDDLSGQFGQFDGIVSLEVVEHLYSPVVFAKNLSLLLRPGAFALISTPYHGYLKNLVLAVTGKMDDHFTALWEHGHIKFWSVKTLSELLRSNGLQVDKYLFAGRFKYLAKSMIAVAQKPA